MRVVPAVDIRGGRCVRLRQGDLRHETVFNDDPVKAACRWRDDRASLVHVVDLDGAVAGRPCAVPLLHKMTEAGVAVEFGGGVRNEEHAEQVLDAGVERVVVGTLAEGDMDQLVRLVARCGPKLVAALDVRDGRVAVDGWLRTTASVPVDCARAVEDEGVSRLIVTSIARDGMMTGPDLEVTRQIAESVDIPVTASGGIATLDDVAAVVQLAGSGVDEMIIGRAFYEGRFTYSEACKAAGQKP